MKRSIKLTIITLLLVLFSVFASFAETEYPWEGSQKDAERAGGLGWVLSDTF